MFWTCFITLCCPLSLFCYIWSVCVCSMAAQCCCLTGGPAGSRFVFVQNNKTFSNQKPFAEVCLVGRLVFCSHASFKIVGFEGLAAALSLTGYLQSEQILYLNWILVIFYRVCMFLRICVATQQLNRKWKCKCASGDHGYALHTMLLIVHSHLPLHTINSCTLWHTNTQTQTHTDTPAVE